jgi:hypothetical protein
MVADTDFRDDPLDQAEQIINRLFGAGLDINRALCQIDGPERMRLLRAVEALDEAIREVRALAVSSLPAPEPAIPLARPRA